MTSQNACKQGCVQCVAKLKNETYYYYYFSVSEMKSNLRTFKFELVENKDESLPYPIQDQAASIGSPASYQIKQDRS